MWMKATEGADGTVFYIDRDSIKKEGNLLRVWELQDLKEKGPLDEKSRRVLVEYDCKNERRRVMSFSFHAEQMGAGLTLKGDQTPGKWNLTVPNTTASVVFQVALALKAPLKSAALPPPPPPPASEIAAEESKDSPEKPENENDPNAGQDSASAGHENEKK
ncbi:MAG: hypothetical protein CBD16_07530 [Betaproteobacteria bacterium TMED156]|nr:MAG: hypothetical protein CBD16_07530 [Betaproteobacteria bacterium TMED156]